MFKVLLLALAVWIVLTIMKQRRSPPPETKTGNMVSCAVCGVHVPESEAIASNGRHYCCEAHRQQRDQA